MDNNQINADSAQGAGSEDQKKGAYIKILLIEDGVTKVEQTLKTERIVKQHPYTVGTSDKGAQISERPTALEWKIDDLFAAGEGVAIDGKEAGIEIKAVLRLSSLKSQLKSRNRDKTKEVKVTGERVTGF